MGKILQVLEAECICIRGREEGRRSGGMREARRLFMMTGNKGVEGERSGSVMETLAVEIKGNIARKGNTKVHLNSKKRVVLRDDGLQSG